MLTINMPQLKSAITHVALKKRRPCYFHGASGIGKSEGIAQSAAEHGGTLVDIRISQYESVDFRGIPDIQAGETVWNMPSTMPFKGSKRFDTELTDPSKPIFLFFDEVNHGDPSVLSVMYQIVNERRVGEHELMDNVHMLLAGNRAKDRGTGGKVPDPLNNRATHFELVPDIKSWSNWAAKAGVSPTLIGFLNFRSELLHTHDPAKPQVAFATPRTWNFVNEDFTDETMPADIKTAAIAGSVGEGPGIELTGFAEIMANIRPISEILADPEGVPIDTALDVQWAMATHVAGHMTKDTTDQLHRFLDRMDPEMVVMAWTLAINRDDSVTDTNAFLYQYATKYRGLFQN